jgi:hypothetical protein
MQLQKGNLKFVCAKQREWTGVVPGPFFYLWDGTYVSI